MKEWQKDEIEQFFYYRWANDRNMAFGEGSLLDQLPDEVQFAIFKDFLFYNFLYRFKKLFVFTRPDMEGKY